MKSSAMTEGAVAPLLTSLIEITEQREQHALEVALGRAIRDLTDANSVTLYRLQKNDHGLCLLPQLCWNKGSEVSSSEMHKDVVPFGSMPEFVACHDTRQIVRLQHGSAGREDLVLPMGGAGDEVGAFYRVDGAHHDAAAERVLPLLLEIYRNFLELLHDNQRDMLTGLLNRKTFDARMTAVLSKLQSPRHRGTDQPEGLYCLAVLDIDHFKRINDNFGHLYGDEVLLLFASLMRDTFRETDMLFRFGGEEFVVLLKDAGLGDAYMVLERFRARVEAKEFPQVGRVTVSCGLTLIKGGELPPQIIDRADKALYYAKNHGRNQVCVYETLLAQGELAAPEVGVGSIELF